MEIKEALKSAGLTDNETTVYLAILEIGARSAGTISKKTGLHRRVVYDITDRLIKKGLLGYIIENKRKIFKASNPRKFLEIIEKEKQEIENIMPYMLSMFNQEKTKQREETLFFKGKNGLKAVFEDQIETGKEIMILGASPMAYELFDVYFHWFDKRRLEKKIPVKIIFNEKTKKRLPLSEIRHLPQKYSSPLAVNIYGDKIALILWNKENPFAILINQKEIADSYKKYFELMWKIAK